MLAMKNPAKIHGAVEASFSGERRRRLWRTDVLAGETYLLVLSEDRGDFTLLDKQFGTGEGWEEREYSPLLSRTENGSVWQFRLRANPVKSVPSKEGRGIVHGHVTPEYQKQWLKDRCEKHGFSLNDDSFEVTQVEHLNFQKGKNGNHVTILAVTFQGTLTVTDQNAFNDLLVNGLGRGKAYGLGMMTIVRAEKR